MSQDPNATNIIVDNGFRPTSVPVDSSRIDVSKETTFDFQNALAIPSKGLLADYVFWVNVFTLALRIPIQLWLWELDVLTYAALIIVGIFFTFYTWLLISFQRPIDAAYRISIIFLSFLIATNVAWYL